MASDYTEYVVRRVAQAIPTLVGLSIVIFTVVRIVPAAPVRYALGPQASQEEVQQLREELGLNDPLPVQFIEWLQGILVGDWGQSLRTGNNVYNDIVRLLPATFELVLVALIIAVLLSVPFGVIAGTHRDKWEDHISRFIALIGVSMPRFWLAILFQLLFVGVLGLFPLTGRLGSQVQPPPRITGLYLVDSLITGQWSTFVNAAKHIALPALSLAIGSLAQLMRLIRSDIIEEGQQDYIMASRAYGIPDKIIVYKYMLKNSFTSALTVIGLSFGFLIGNAFLVEVIFAWPGMARYGVNGLLALDYNAIVGVVITTGVAFLFANLVVDLLYGYLDPRVRHEGS